VLVRWGAPAGGGEEEAYEDPPVGIVLGRVSGRWMVTRWEQPAMTFDHP
jgi:hypothetical protein